MATIFANYVNIFFIKKNKLVRMLNFNIAVVNISACTENSRFLDIINDAGMFQSVIAKK